MSVRVRFFFGGWPSCAPPSAVEGLVGPPSISVSAMSPWEDAEGLERSTCFLLRRPDWGSEEELAAAGSMWAAVADDEDGCGAAWPGGEEARGAGWVSEGCARLGGEVDGWRCGEVRVCWWCSPVGRAEADEDASAALRDMFIEREPGQIASERLQLSTSRRALR